MYFLGASAKRPGGMKDETRSAPKQVSLADVDLPCCRFVLIDLVFDPRDSQAFAGGWTPSPLHNYGQRSNAMGSYNCLVNLNGHRHLSGKTLLYFIDGLYPARNQSNDVIRWQSFGDDWTSSLFASQDPIAIDSVALDFLRNEPRNTDVTGNPDNYLHEAAFADDPPSGT